MSSYRREPEGMRNLRKQIALARTHFAKVGVLGDSAARGVVPLDTSYGPLQPSAGLNNPSLGYVHEFGSTRAKPPVPQRSFLRTPLIDRLGTGVREVGPDKWAKLFRKGAIPALQRLGVVGENIVQHGFATGGYGKWRPLQPATIAIKGSSAILIETAHLRKSIHSAVVTRA